MKLSDLVKTFLQNYNFLIDQLAYLFIDEDCKLYISDLNKETKDKKWQRGLDFNKLLNDEHFDLFIESKTKLFSHSEEITKTISESLFGEKLSLKKIFHNRDESIRFVLWYYLFIMNLMIEISKKEKNEERIKKLGDLIDSNIAEYEKSKEAAKKLNETGMSDPKNIIKDVLGVNVNNQTNDMLGDIVKSFESSLSGLKSGQPPDMATLIPNILEISKNISSKYADKISSGEIELDKIMGGITKNIPGMNLDMNNLNSMMGNLGGLGGMFKKPEKKETVVIDENFSTANVDLGKINESQGLNIGKMLSVADSFGIIPGPDKNTDGEDGGDAALDGMPKLNDLFGMMSNMKNPQDMKNQLEGMMGKLGIDLSKLGLDKDMGKLDMSKLDLNKMFKPKPDDELD
jgi:hypothetical protein